MSTIDCGLHLRILIVDDEPNARRDYAELVRIWGHTVVVAEGDGSALEDDAVCKARTHHCHLAIVDMCLRDAHDREDISGLRLCKRLLPSTSSIIITAHGYSMVGEAFKEYDAVDYISKSENVERLRDKIVAACQRQNLAGNATLRTIWEDNSIDSAIIKTQLLPGRPDAPADEIDILLGKLFRDNQRILMRMITPTSSSSDRNAVLRRKSRVFQVQVDRNQAALFVKIAQASKIEREITNYNKYVRDATISLLRPELVRHDRLWNLGAVAYRYVAAHFADSSLPTFTKYYGEAETAEDVMRPLREFFSPASWGIWYTSNVNELTESLFDSYDALWRGNLGERLPDWQNHDPIIAIKGVPGMFTNPLRWLAHNHHKSFAVLSRQTVVHGDLHGDNLFVDDKHAWVVDFERTGPGPILCDFVELLQDLLTRIVPCEPAQVPTYYALLVALCDLSTPDGTMHQPVVVANDPAAAKTFDLVQRILKLAHSVARYTDIRELLWGLLLNNIFVLTVIDHNDDRYGRTLLFASLLCTRLERWNHSSWLGNGWPDVPRVSLAKYVSHSVDPTSTVRATVPAPPLPAVFCNGYALLVGVGGDLPMTATDARAVAALLTNPERGSYPRGQVQCLTDGDATRAGVLRGLDALAERAQQDSDATVVVYFSGHGVLLPDFYLVPHGFDWNAPEQTGIKGSELIERLEMIAARKLLVLLDCCHAGGIHAVKQPVIKAPLPPGLPDMLRRGAGQVVIASSRRNEVSYANAQYSYFTQALLQGLAGHGANTSDGYARIADIAMYVSQSVAEQSHDRQHPLLHIEGADNFAVAYYAGGAKTTRPLDL